MLLIQSYGNFSKLENFITIWDIPENLHLKEIISRTLEAAVSSGVRRLSEGQGWKKEAFWLPRGQFSVFCQPREHFGMLFEQVGHKGLNSSDIITCFCVGSTYIHTHTLHTLFPDCVVSLFCHILFNQVVTHDKFGKFTLWNSFNQNHISWKSKYF